MSTAEAKILEARALQYQDYPKDFKASVIAAIEANGGNVAATAKLFNISKDTVYYWWRNSERYCEIQSPSALSLADKLESIAHNTADSIAAHDLSIVSVRDKAQLLSTAIDKMQLLRGQPTEIVETVQSRQVLVLLGSALGVEDAIDITPEREITEVKPEDGNVLEGTLCESE